MRLMIERMDISSLCELSFPSVYYIIIQEVDELLFSTLVCHVYFLFVKYNNTCIELVDDDDACVFWGNKVRTRLYMCYNISKVNVELCLSSHPTWLWDGGPPKLFRQRPPWLDSPRHLLRYTAASTYISHMLYRVFGLR